ncbi:LysR substrate-binding domain-containing protein [Ramlibacter sp.]|uniref:LysR family transcriptional regulator n=1 Tax=Ramlibacter sp. TaxID=1917967 RepID=UPI003D0FF352
MTGVANAANPATFAVTALPVGFEDLASLRIFARVVELQSFSEAARRMGITPSTVSKHISALEEQFGTRLVNRTTRRLSITDAGTRLYQTYRRVIGELQDVRDELAAIDSEPKGHLRVSLPISLGARKIAPALPDFLKRYPAITLGIDLSPTRVDLLGEDIELAVRIADRLPDGAVALRLAPYRRVFCAAPSYLAERGVPRTPEDIESHDCLVVPVASGGMTWTLNSPEGVVSVPVKGRMVVNHGDAIYDAAIAGLGLSMQPRWRVQEALADGRLVEVLQEYIGPKLWIWAVLARRGAMPSKVNAFVEFLRATLADLA